MTYSLVVGAAVTMGYASLRTWYETHRNNKIESEIHTCKIEIGKLKSKIHGNTKNEKHDLSKVGVNGLLDEFGIDPSLLKNPIVQKLINKYAGQFLGDSGDNNKNDIYME